MTKRGDLLGRREVCARLGISERLVYKLVARGELPSIKIGGRRLFDPADIDAYIGAHKTFEGEPA